MATHVKVASPLATVEGKTISQWTQDWMKWVFHAPATTPVGTPFPPDADTSANANVDNSGPVFFLYGGNWGSDPAHLPTINVAAGKGHAHRPGQGGLRDQLRRQGACCLQ